MPDSTQFALLTEQRDALQSEAAKHALPQSVVFRINMLSMAIDEVAKPPSPVREFIRRRAATHQVSMNQMSDWVAGEIGVSTATLKKWQSTGIPRTGNKRNVKAIEMLEQMMAGAA